VRLGWCGVRSAVRTLLHTHTHTHIYIYGPGSSVGIAADYGLDGPGSTLDC